ncbi:unnamed protein product [Choristocarpus tenellus]
MSKPGHMTPRRGGGSRRWFRLTHLTFAILIVVAFSTLVLQIFVVTGPEKQNDELLPPEPIIESRGGSSSTKGVSGTPPPTPSITMEPFFDPDAVVPLEKISTPRSPFGWGGDWVHELSVFANVMFREGVRGLQEVISPPWCQTSENQSLVDYILERRQNVDPLNRVAACVRTKNMARYLPEWVAYHWVAGIDEFMVYDDHSTDGTRQVLEPFILTST